MRVAASIVLALAALVAVSAASARDPRDPQQRHTAADTKLAQSIAVQRSDLPAGWKAQPKSKPAPPCSVEPDESKLVETARIDPTFLWKDGATTVGTEVDVFRTTREAKIDWRLTTLKLIRACLLESARRAWRPRHVTVSVASSAILTPPKHGERSFHYRIVFLLKGKREMPVVTELIGFGVGRISVVLHAVSPYQSLPASGLDHLTTRVANRLVGASGGI